MSVNIVAIATIVGNYGEAVKWANDLPGTDIAVNDYPEGVISHLKSLSISQVYPGTGQAAFLASAVVEYEINNTAEELFR